MHKVWLIAVSGVFVGADVFVGMVVLDGIASVVFVGEGIESIVCRAASWGSVVGIVELIDVEQAIERAIIIIAVVACFFLIILHLDHYRSVDYLDGRDLVCIVDI